MFSRITLCLFPLMFLVPSCEEARDTPLPNPDDKSDTSMGVVMKGEIGFDDAVISSFDESKLHGYTFRGAKGAQVDLKLTADPDVFTDTIVYLYGPPGDDGLRGEPIALDDDGAENRFSQLDLTLPADGEYLIVASCLNYSYQDRSYELALGCHSERCAPELNPELKKISVEVDYVGYQRFFPGVREHIVDYYSTIGYELVFEESEELEPVDFLEFGSDSEQLKNYYLEHFNHRGEQSWHYMLMGDKLLFSNVGWASLGGDMFIISAGPLNFTTEHKLEAQANIIMHELGHNLGLLHEGFEPEVSAGTHNKGTCATADKSPTPDIPVTHYSDECIGHINLESIPYVPAEQQ